MRRRRTRDAEQKRLATILLLIGIGVVVAIYYSNQRQQLPVVTWILTGTPTIEQVDWDDEHSDVMFLEGRRDVDITLSKNIILSLQAYKIQVQREGDRLSELHIDLGYEQTDQAYTIAKNAFKLMNMPIHLDLDEWYDERKQEKHVIDDRFQYHVNSEDPPFSFRVVRTYEANPPWRILLSIYFIR